MDGPGVVFSANQKLIIKSAGSGTMNTKEILINEITQIPEPLLGELLDFVLFLKTKLAREKFTITIMSETSLGKDWLSPEEDKAWENL